MSERNTERRRSGGLAPRKGTHAALSLDGEATIQHTEQELDRPVSPAPTEPVSEHLHLTPEEADAIFRQAEAELQPILRKIRKDRFIGWVQGVLCASLILFSMAGIVWQCLMYPHTLVVLYTKANPASITTTLDVPTRTLAPNTITRSFTVPTTGHGHQDAQAATGTLTFYNGQNTPQRIPVGTVLTGQDGTMGASAIQAGRQGNIAPYDINFALTSVLTVQNQTPFTHGREARDFQAVGQQDIQSLTSTVQKTLEKAFTTAFLLRPGEQAQPINCHTTTSADHGLGQEAQTVTVKTIKTCSAIAYSQGELTREATAAFTQTEPAANYRIVGSVQTTVQSVSPVSVTISGKWAYTFSPDYQQLLAQQIEGDTPAQARKVLVQTGVISYASVPNTLPPSTYINFLVLVG